MNGNRQTKPAQGCEDVCRERSGSLELVVHGGGKERCFPITELHFDEVEVAGSDLDLGPRRKEAAIHYCDGNLMDEISCRIVLRATGVGAERGAGAGAARVRVFNHQGEHMDVVRLVNSLERRAQLRRDIERARLTVACGWL
ncbi:hypothetical protein G6O69_09230 [Pseudenhygromyxa sp. WMMC2535]|uniref:hypothetical protein n=1 Tax=Pseudenhygromyxa sp. WMMC2535 TaxID=2712867 RepID=UPI0015519E91|nr:hypothetical protein [Pseudenhygromyxa sp. WMMC2535]NVB38013.1 hypothetical protein [Pseudenhygromyxa sp. WMMC2535]